MIVACDIIATYSDHRDGDWLERADIVSHVAAMLTLFLVLLSC